MSSRLRTSAFRKDNDSHWLRARPARAGFVQRKCTFTDSRGLNAKCEECTENRLNRQRSAADKAAPSIVEDVLHSPGKPLDKEVRATMEARFGHDFSRVRVHTEGSSAESARAVHARAYTVGQQIVFGERQYSPESEGGKTLLAHELAHTIQQGEGRHPVNGLALSDPGDALEREADLAAAAAVVTQDYVMPTENAAPVLARAPDDPEPASTSTAAPGGPETGTAPPTGGPSAAQTSEAGPADAETQPPAKVCLTFDDGPHAGTRDVLDGLGTIKATFFLQGSKMVASNRLMLEGDKLIAAETKQAELVAEILAKGHQIGNHTFWHVPFKKDEYEQLRSEPAADQKTTITEGFTKNLEYFQGLYERHKDAFAQQGITEFPGFTLGRLPGQGKFYPDYVAMVEGLGLKHVGWDGEFAPEGKLGAPKGTSNWKGIPKLDAEMVGCPANKNILLLHDTLWEGKQALLEAFIDKLKTGCNCEFGVLNASGQCS